MADLLLPAVHYRVVDFPSVDGRYTVQTLTVVTSLFFMWGFLFFTCLNDILVLTPEANFRS